MTQEVSSISRVGTSEPFELQVARGQIAFHKSIFKFGFNPDIDDSLETIWAQGGLYSYLSSATTLYISSSSTADDAAGTGARTATVSGLDANYDEVSVTVDLDGQNGVQLGSASNWIRVNRVTVNTAGSGGQNAGVIYVGDEASPTSGVPSNKYATIAIGDNQTLMALWTVPRGYTAFVTQTDVTAATTQNNKYATVSFVARENGGVFQVKDKFVKAESSHHQQYDIPLKFEEKTDLEFRCIGDSSGANIAISAAMDIIYIENRPYPE
tara:strand:+ start:3071 stop:3874 length:804 start_codon:yes stop_codon:yes gene_type:complete